MYTILYLADTDYNGTNYYGKNKRSIKNSKVKIRYIYYG